MCILVVCKSRKSSRRYGCTHRTSVSDSCAPGAGGLSSEPAAEDPLLRVGLFPPIFDSRLDIGGLFSEEEDDWDDEFRLRNKPILFNELVENSNTKYAKA